MTAVFEPAELLTAALSALFLAVPLAVVVAAGVLAVPRRMVSAPGLGIGIGLLAGVVLAAVSIVAGPLGLLRTGVSLASVLGLLCVMAAAVLIVVRREPARPEAVLGTVGCALVGLGEPGQALPVLFGLSSSVLVVVTALVMEAVVIAALGGALAGLGGRIRAVRWGVAVAALVAGVLMLWGLLAAGLERLLSTTVPAVPMLPMIIVVGAALVAGTVAAVVLETRSAPRGPAPVERNEPGSTPPTPPG